MHCKKWYLPDLEKFWSYKCIYLGRFSNINNNFDLNKYIYMYLCTYVYVKYSKYIFKLYAMFKL